MFALGTFQSSFVSCRSYWHPRIRSPHGGMSIIFAEYSRVTALLQVLPPAWVTLVSLTGANRPDPADPLRLPAFGILERWRPLVKQASRRPSCDRCEECSVRHLEPLSARLSMRSNSIPPQRYFYSLTETAIIFLLKLKHEELAAVGGACTKTSNTAGKAINAFLKILLLWVYFYFLMKAVRISLLQDETQVG